MSEATHPDRPRSLLPGDRPWSQAWIDGFPGSPAVAGVGLALLHLVASAAWYAGLVAPAPAEAWQAVRAALASIAVFAVLIGYGPAALAYARRGHRATLAALGPRLRCSEAERDDLRREVERFDMGLLRAVGVGVSICSIVITVFTTGLIERFGARSPALMWVTWQNVLAFWLVSRAVAHDLRGSWLLSRGAERWLPVDPLDQAPLSPLARRGLQSALLILLALSIFSPVFGLDDLSPFAVLSPLMFVVLAACALFLPSAGVHRRLRAAKAGELERLASEIRAARAAGDSTGLAPLLTLRQHLEAARGWPFDLGTLGRFALYAAIGLGSWLGGALVERLLDVVLG